MITEITYYARDNAIDLLLKADGEAQDLSAVTRIVLDLGSTEIDSAEYGSVFTWVGTGTTGKLIIKLASASAILLPKTYTAYLILYDAVNTNGIVWGSFQLTIGNI